MRSFLNSIYILLLASGLAAGQTAAQTTTAKPAAAAAKPATAKAAEKPAASGAAGLPTEATVDSFLHQQFGYEADLTLAKISSIRAFAPGSGNWPK